MSNSTYVLDDKLLTSTGSRFLNYILDVVTIVLLVFALSFIAAIVANFLDLNEFLYWMGNLSDWEGQLIFGVTSIFYYSFTEGLFGRTLGKLIMGTVVVDENGEKPSFSIIFKRTLCRLIPFDGFSFLGSRGWHDSISGTYVVSKKDLENEVKLFHEFNLIGNNEVI